MTHLLGGAAGRWWKYLRQPTIATLAAVTVVLTLFLSSVFVNQQAAMVCMYATCSYFFSPLHSFCIWWHHRDLHL
jgi:hypothetical protein